MNYHKPMDLVPKTHLQNQVSMWISTCTRLNNDIKRQNPHANFCLARKFYKWIRSIKTTNKHMLEHTWTSWLMNRYKSMGLVPMLHLQTLVFMFWICTWKRLSLSTNLHLLCDFLHVNLINKWNDLHVTPMSRKDKFIW